MPHRILIVDDNEQYRTMLRSLTTMRGYEVVTARTGAEGLALAQTGTIHAVLSDVDMPGMDGFEFCRQVREQAKTRNQDLPVWIMSGLFSPVLTKRAAAAGAMLVLRKPFPIDEMCRQLEAEFQKRAQAGSASPAPSGPPPPTPPSPAPR
jgi:DNA-binding response OmpR family regulator